jgi:sterol desaturase/sphingolipid hydroxylase (fatty acid hydroxylase superfamily)
MKRTIAAAEILLTFPATLFMTALFVRNVQPNQFEPARSAQRIVEWYSLRPHIALHLFLMVMPFAAFVIGCTATLRIWQNDADVRKATHDVLGAIRDHFSTLLIAFATLMASGILAVVALHALAD